MPVLSKGIDFKIAIEKIPVIDITCCVKESIKNVCAKALAENEFRIEC